MDVKSLIATVMQTNGMLGIIDQNQNGVNITLNEIQNEWSKKYLLNAKTHSFLNQYQYITSLLAFIVIPKESFWDQIPNIKTSELPENWGLKGKGELKLSYFIRRIRNSISHGGIEISEDLVFSFIDINPRDKSDVFECVLNQNELRSFVHAFANFIITGNV